MPLSVETPQGRLVAQHDRPAGGRQPDETLAGELGQCARDGLDGEAQMIGDVGWVVRHKLPAPNEQERISPMPGTMSGSMSSH